MQAITNEANGIVKVDGDTWTAMQMIQLMPREKKSYCFIKRHSTILQVKKESEKPMVALTLTIIFALIVVTFIALTIKNYSTAKVGVVERFGKFQRVMQPGLNLLIPIVDRVQRISRLAYSTNECTTAEGNYER